MQWRNPYDIQENHQYDLLSAIDFSQDPGKTIQAPAEEQDINVIMKRFGITDGSVLPRWHAPEALYGDFTEVPSDPVEAAEYLRLGELSYIALPADIRRQFDSGAHLYNWLKNPDNAKEAFRLGLLEQLPAQPATLDTLADLMRQQVSTSTSSDKEPLVPTSNSKEK